MKSDYNHAADTLPDKAAALSRQFGEGGYTFLKRVLKTHFETGRPVLLNVGNAYAAYVFAYGQTRFSQGVTPVGRDDDDHAIGALREVGERYEVGRGIVELAREHPALRDRLMAAVTPPKSAPATPVIP